jgi:hypothetical protein
VQPSWKNEGLEYNFITTVSDSGWMQADVLLEWFEKVSKCDKVGKRTDVVKCE